MSDPMSILTLDMAANITRTHGADTLRALAADRLAVAAEGALEQLRELHRECYTPGQCPILDRITQLEQALAEWRAVR